jgi:hypothetical protein
MAHELPTPPRAEPPPSIGELVDLVTTYAKQETIGPLRGAGRWLGFGAAAAFVLGIGFTLVLLGLLRLLQAEWEWAAQGSWSWIPYVIVLVAAAAVIAVTLSRINKSSLNEEP